MDGNSYKIIGERLESAAKLAVTLLIIFVPLGLWKLIEIIVWLYKHINITFN